MDGATPGPRDWRLVQAEHIGIPALSRESKMQTHMHKTYSFFRAARELLIFWDATYQPDKRIQTPDIRSPVA
jgi:hypothetical protein